MTPSHSPRTLTLLTLAALSCSGCGGLDFDLDFSDAEFGRVCPWERILEFADPLRASEGVGMLWGVCSTDTCGEDHPLAVGVEAEIRAYARALDSSTEGTLESSDEDVLRVVAADTDERESCRAAPSKFIPYAATLQVVGPGQADLELHREGEEIVRWRLHAAAAAQMEVSVAPSLVDVLLDAGATLPEGGQPYVPPSFEDGDTVVTARDQELQVELWALDHQGRQLVVGAGPSGEGVLVASELYAEPPLVRIAEPRGGISARYEVTPQSEGTTALMGAFPDLGVSDSLQLRVLTSMDYEQAQAAQP